VTPDLQPLNPDCCLACRELAKLRQDTAQERDQDDEQEDRAAANLEQPHQTDHHPEEPASHT
jgi:hypothetical protein